MIVRTKPVSEEIPEKRKYSLACPVTRCPPPFITSHLSSACFRPYNFSGRNSNDHLRSKQAESRGRRRRPRRRSSAPDRNRCRGVLSRYPLLQLPDPC